MRADHSSPPASARSLSVHESALLAWPGLHGLAFSHNDRRRCGRSIVERSAHRTRALNVRVCTLFCTRAEIPGLHTASLWVFPVSGQRPIRRGNRVSHCSKRQVQQPSSGQHVAARSTAFADGVGDAHRPSPSQRGACGRKGVM